jgi:hypothetical protein
MKILALDLGKFNSVSWFYDTKTQAAEYWTWVEITTKRFNPLEINTAAAAT